jgi:hypothetical protein
LLILAVIALLTILLWTAFRKKNWGIKLASLALAVVGTLIFVLNEDMTLKIGFNVDIWALPLTVILVCEVIAIVLAKANANKIEQAVTE